MLNNQTVVNHVFSVVKKQAPDLSFTLLDVGALPVGQLETFYLIPEHFPKTRVIGFEVDPEVCKQLNDKTPAAFEFHATALGRSNGEAPFYITRHPMCSSLYQPNVELYRYFNGLDVGEIDRVTTIRTTTLDSFCQQQGIDRIDFIKLDVQGAELDIFQGGLAALASTVMILTEVEFVPLYHNQPLFGDINTFLTERGFLFHKFTNMGGRSMKPLLINNDPNTAVQLLWGDAVYIRDIRKLDALTPEQLLRLSVLSCIYGSPDLTLHCLGLHDAKTGCDLQRQLMQLFGI